MSGVVSGIPLEAPLPRASAGPVLPDLYFLFITILRQLREDMPEVVVRAQIVQLCCFRNTVNKSTGSGTFCCVMEHPVLLADAESPDSPLGSRVIDRNISIGRKYF